MTTHTIYGPATWSLTAFRSDPRTPKLLEWLRANGIDTASLPVEQAISVDTTDHGSVIRHVAYLTNSDGQLIAAGDSPVFEARTVPLLVDPPDELRPDTWPAPATEQETPPAPAALHAVTDPAAVNGQAPGLVKPEDCPHATIAEASTYGDGQGSEHGVCAGCGAPCTRPTGGQWQPVADGAQT